MARRKSNRNQKRDRRGRWAKVGSSLRVGGAVLGATAGTIVLAGLAGKGNSSYRNHRSSRMNIPIF